MNFAHKAHQTTIFSLIFLENGFLTEKSGANILGDLVAGSAGLGKVAQLLVQHPFELKGKRDMCEQWLI